MTGDDISDPDELFSGVEDAEGINLEKRPRGILSHTDREYLCGLRDYAHAQSEANRKQDIRERIVHSFQDYPLLWLLLDEEEREKAFQEAADRGYLDGMLQSMITFVYLGLDQDTNRLEKIIETGVYIGANYDKAGRWVGEATDVDVSIDIEYNPDVEKLYDRFQRTEGDQLTPAEIGVLVRAGKLNQDDLEKLEDSGPTFPGVYPFTRS